MQADSNSDLQSSPAKEIGQVQQDDEDPNCLRSQTKGGDEELIYIERNVDDQND